MRVANDRYALQRNGRKRLWKRLRLEVGNERQKGGGGSKRDPVAVRCYVDDLRTILGDSEASAAIIFEIIFV